MTNNIQLTDKAIKAVQDALDNDETITYLRVGVRGSGCFGYSYYFEYEMSKKDNDFVFQFKDIIVIVDPKSIKLLEGSTIDYHNSLMKSEFKINNPNAVSKCGCN